jgi:putative MATE family efflux protein
MKYTGTQLMENAPVSQAIIRLALPMVAAMLAQAIYNMTDMFFIGKTGNPNMVAAVSLVFPIFMLSQAIGNVFATGGSSYISRLLGLKNTGEAKNSSAVSFYLAITSGLLLAVILLGLKTRILNLIGASEGTFAHADGYFSIVILFMPFAVASTLFSGLMRSEGATDKAMTLQLVGIVLNIILDPVFILQFGWGTKGAAWATIAGQLASFAYGLWYFYSKKSTLSIRFKNSRPNKTMLRELFFIGIPAGLSNLLMSVAAILGNRIAAGYGDYVVAGSGVQMRIASMCFMFVFALTMGYQPFAGFNYGAKNFVRLKQGFKVTVFLTTIVCCTGCLTFFLFGDFLIRFFIDDEKTIEAGASMLRVFIFGLLVLGIQATLMTTFQALGKSTAAMLVSLGRQLLFYVPFLYLLNGLFGFNGFIFAQPAADIFTSVLALVLSRPIFRIMRGSLNKLPLGQFAAILGLCFSFNACTDWFLCQSIPLPEPIRPSP